MTLSSEVAAWAEACHPNQQDRNLARFTAGLCTGCGQQTYTLRGQPWAWHKCKQTRLLTARFNMVMTPLERDMLQAVAIDTDSGEAEALRALIRESYARRFGVRTPPPHVPKYNSHTARMRRERHR